MCLYGCGEERGVSAQIERCVFVYVVRCLFGLFESLCVCACVCVCVCWCILRVAVRILVFDS